MNTLVCSRSASPAHLLYRLFLLLALALPARAAVIEYTLPLPFRTSGEYVNASPAVYSPTDPGSIIFPLDLNADGQNEFIINYNSFGGGAIRLYSARSTNQVITTLASEVIFGMETNPYAIPGPPGIEIGPAPPGTGIKWGVFNPAPVADILGLGPMAGYYGLASQLGGQSGYYTSLWNRTLPSDWDYLPMRFELEDGLHYGYLRLAYEDGLNGAFFPLYGVLRGWAWETEPGRGILIVPEPSAGWLAAGTCGLFLRHRRRRA